MRTVIGIAVAIAVCCAAGCAGGPTLPPPPSPTATAATSPTASSAGTTSLDCSDPIGVVSSPTVTKALDAVGLDTGSTLQVSRTDGTDPHRLFAKTGLLVHVGREATVTVPAGWANRVAIAWGNHAAEWTVSLHVPACTKPSWGTGEWLAFPGGFSIDRAACVPLEVHVASKTTTVQVPVGVPCPG